MVEQTMRQLLMHSEHLTEYAASLRRLESTAAASSASPAAEGGAKASKKRPRGDAGVASNYTAPALEALAQLANEDDESMHTRGAAAAAAASTGSAAAGQAARALLLPVQPLLLGWFRQSYAVQREALDAERSTRQRPT